MKVTLLVLTLNEIEGMKQIMPRIKRDWYDQLIIIDGGSTDGTVKYAKENNYFLISQRKKGMRDAYMATLEYITGDIVITFSPDGNSIPELIPDLINKIQEGYDMVIVSRYLGNAQSYDDDIITAFGNWFFTKTINFFYHGHYTDALVLFRAYRTQLIYDLDLDKDESYLMVEKLFQTNISWEPLLSIRAAKRRLKIAEIPGDEPPRISGNKKLKILKWGAAYYFQFIRELFFWQ